MQQWKDDAKHTWDVNHQEIKNTYEFDWNNLRDAMVFSTIIIFKEYWKNLKIELKEFNEIIFGIY